VAMIKFIKLFFLCLMLFVLISDCFANSHPLAKSYWIQARSLSKQLKYLEAAQMYLKSAEAEKAHPKPRLINLSQALYQAGENYRIPGQLDKALACYNEALVISKRLDRKGDIAFLKNGIGMIYKLKGQYDKALKNYEDALAIDRKLDRKLFVAVRLNNIAKVYAVKGQYDKALKNYEDALAFYKKITRGEGLVGITLSNIGSIYFSQGRYDIALEHQKKALSIGRKIKRDSSISRSLISIGKIYKYWGRYDESLKYYEEALALKKKRGLDYSTVLSNISALHLSNGQFDKAIKIAKEVLVKDRNLGRESGIAVRLNIIASAYRGKKQYGKAIEYQEKALEIEKKIGRKGDVAINLNNMGLYFVAKMRYRKALKNFEEAMTINKTLKKEDNLSTNLHNIGLAYGFLKQYDKAIKYFKDSVELKEKLRKTAMGDLRRDYLASQIGTYQLLASAYCKSDNPKGVFQSIEQSRAKLLSERIAKSASGLIIPTLREVQNGLNKDEAVLIFSNIDKDNFILMAITSNDVSIKEINKNSYLVNAIKNYRKPILLMLDKQRGISIKEGTKENLLSVRNRKNKSAFDKSINYYRMLLVNSISDDQEGVHFSETNRAFKNFSNILYELLIKPVEDSLVGKNKLTIVPDGILGFLPFETLVDQHNEYLTERLDIKYTQSMTILKLLKKRKYNNSRRSMLAFGGAVYDQVSYAEDMIENQTQLAYLERSVFRSTREKKSLRNIYARLGKANWGNLPGTLQEVKVLSGIIKDADVVTGDNVSENNVKRLAKNGNLAQYKILHFATHGLVVPEIPELSALVLSQFKDEKREEDGYLRMDEIAKLNIKADFVNLSACETGLGKIYRGEGVVGLAQSFLVAGASGLSVSLWQVSDDSTSKFMTELYKKVQEKGIGYSQATTEVKRGFINGVYGEQWKSPYYWSPFVYYGK